MSTLRIAGRTEVFAGEGWQAAFATAVASVLLGVVIMVWPNKSDRVAGTLFGLCVLLTVCWQLTLALRANIGRALRILELLSAILVAVLAIWCVRSGDWVQLLALWIAMGWAVHGIVQAVVAVWSEELGDTGRLEFCGLLTLAAALVVVIWPIETLDALSMLAGVALLAVGALEIYSCARIERPADTGREVGVGRLLRARP